VCASGVTDCNGTCVDLTSSGNPLNERLLREYAIKGVPTVVFGFFALMPWYSKIDSHKPVPERVTSK
jgi:hypothetical protein